MAKKIILFVVIAIVVLLGVGLWYANYVYIPQKLKPLLIDALEKSLDKKVTISQAQYFPFKGVMLSGIDIRGRDGTAFLTVKNIDLRLKSFPRLKPNDVQANGQLVVQEFNFYQQTITVSGNARVELDAGLKGKEKPTFTAALTMEKAALRGIASAPDILNINGTIHATEAKFRTADLSAEIQKKQLRISVEGAYTEDEVTFAALGVSFAERTLLNASGAIRNFKAPAAQLNFDASVALADINLLLREQKLPALEGTLTLKGDIQGPVQKLKDLRGNLTVAAGRIKVDKLQLSTLDLKAVLDQGKLVCDPCTVLLYDGTVQAKAVAQIDDPALLFDAVVDLEKINLLPLITDMTGQDVGGGMVSAHAAVKGPAMNQFALTGAGWFKMIDGTVQIPSRLDKVAKTLQIKQMEYMVINDASATFTIHDAKVDSQDIAVNADIGAMTAAGYVGFDQSLDVEVLVRLGKSALEAAGGVGNLSQFVSDRNGLPVTKIKIFGRMPDAMQHRVIPLPVGDILKSAVPSIINGDETSPGLKQEIEKGMDALKGIFQKN